MSEPKRKSDPLEILRTAPIGVATPSELEQERERLVPWLEERVLDLPGARHRAQVRRRRWIAASVGLSAAAAALALVWVKPSAEGTLEAGREASAPPVLLVEGTVESGESQILSGSRLGATSRVRTTGEHTAVLQADAGYRLHVARETEVVMSPSQLRLFSGEIELSVPKLPPGQTLEVRALDTTVRVRGTRFSVELPRDEGRETAERVCVRVTEGLVEVERGAEKLEVRPGGSAGCEAPEPAETPSASTSSSSRSMASRGSSLAEENRWLAAALAAERGGRLDEARRSYRELLRRYPRSRFSPEARAGLERVEKRWAADAPR